jgi:hypothetical protein
LHALEHFGLGRYGDPLAINGYRQGFENLCRMLEPGGWLYFSVPIGRERIDFNAQRVFAVSTIMALAKDQLELVDFSYVDDTGALHERVGMSAAMLAGNCGLHFGCGIFEFRKLAGQR